MKKRRIPPAASQTSSPDALLGVPWTPFARCHPDPREPEVEIWLNSRYQVHLRRIELKSRRAGARPPFLSTPRAGAR